MLRLILLFAMASGLMSCAPSGYCGLPCDTGEQSYTPTYSQPARPTPSNPRNQFGTVYGHLVVETMTPEELLLEKTDLELLLSKSQTDLAILQSLSARDNGEYTTNYSGRVGGLIDGVSYQGTTTTRRNSSWADWGNDIAIAVKRSRNERLFNRYREVVLALEQIRIDNYKRRLEAEQSTQQPAQPPAGMIELKN